MDSLKEDIAKTLKEHGADERELGYGIHSWRCTYYWNLKPEVGGGPCTHFEELVEALAEAAKRYNTDT